MPISPIFERVFEYTTTHSVAGNTFGSLGLGMLTWGLTRLAGGRLAAGSTMVVLGIASLMRVPGDQSQYWRHAFPAMMVIGIGMAGAVAPLTNTVLSAMDQRRQGMASGINNPTAPA